MIATQANGRMGGFGRSRANRKGFTAIELLVVVLVVGMLAGMLMPAMARLREGERTLVCLNNLKQFGYGILQYVSDNDGSLPGPTDLAIRQHAARELLPLDSDTRAWYGAHLTAYLEPYIGGTADGPRPAEMMAFCPTAEGIPRARDPNSPIPAYRLQPTYVLNSCGRTNRLRNPVYPYSLMPYHGTNPPNYFGRVSLPPSLPNTLPPEYQPKRLDAIANHATEWAVADLWAWYAGGGLTGIGPVGTWSYSMTNSTTGTVYVQGKLKCPGYPFHLTTKTFHGDLAQPDPSLGSPRLMSGKTNAVYFDGHAASVSPWLGTVNPLFGW